MDLIPLNQGKYPVSASNTDENSLFENLKRLFYMGTFFKGAKHKSKRNEKTISEKIIEPSGIQTIERLYTNPEDPFETKVIDKFLHFVHCPVKDVLPMPHTNTFAMPCRPLISKVVMKNGLVYLAAISEVGEISWFKSIGGKVSGFNPAGYTPDEIRQLSDRKEIFPAGDLNRNYYKIILYPYHDDGHIHKDDYLDVGLMKDFPLNSRKPVEVDGRLFLNSPSFQGLNQENCSGVLYPPHLLKVFKKLEEYYEKEKPTLGQMIYTLFSNKKGTGEGEMHPIYIRRPLDPPLSKGARRTSRFLGSEVVNPNIPRKLSLQPKSLYNIRSPLLNEREN